MATVKKGNGTTKRRRTKATSAGQQSGAEKLTTAVQPPNGDHANGKAPLNAAAQEPRKVPVTAAVEPVAKPALSKPIVEPVPNKPTVEPTVTAVRADFVPAKPAAEITPSKVAPAKPDAEAIRVRAYHLFLARGGIPGNDLEDWLAAERQLIDETRAD